MTEFKRYTVTAALPYANGPLHIGHIAGAYLPADTYVRYLRLKRREVVFVCGSDEYGAAITMRAKKEGITPRQIIDKYHTINKNAFERFGISFDIYHRTSEPIHTETSQNFFLKLHQQGLFEVQESEQYYDEQAQQFLADRYIVGTCPKCSNPKAYGDQCEKCGSSLSPLELINPVSTLSGTKPVLRTTKHWYLPMQQFEPWLREWIVHEKQHQWKPNVYGQCKSWIEQGLQPRSMTRDLDWGVPVPLPEAQGKVLYVWLDAPIGYISATKEWAKNNGKNWEDYWKRTDTKLVHFIGKDNIVFHCIIFPILLKAHGEFILPTDVPANEFLNLEGDKISTSRNWAVWLEEYMNDFPQRTDELRYVLTAISPETGDSEFTWRDFQARVNNELVAILGNFINRVWVLVHKYFEGKLPGSGTIHFSDQSLQQAVEHTFQMLQESLESYKFKQGLNILMDLVRDGNKYLTEGEPWKKIDSAPEQVADILNNCVLLAAHLAVYMQPYLPNTAVKLFQMLNISPNDCYWDAPIALNGGHQLSAPQLLFQKIEDAAIEQQIQKLEKNKLMHTAVAPFKEPITYEDFAKLDIRIATVVACQKVPKAKKLLQLTLDTGIDQRTVVSGIAEYFEPASLVGKQVLLVANLAPREMRGIVSQGMILTAQDRDGRLVLVSPEDLVMSGSQVS
ncbi:MAG: methionine--tRNA ligase [Cytophagales bacterium]|nr:methionine--tRNA ligase [Bernardetiaceae bacterium]MDW8203466.1 methionine--tRNA ligase [Cytophagales bacterium]